MIEKGIYPRILVLKGKMSLGYSAERVQGSEEVICNKLKKLWRDFKTLSMDESDIWYEISPLEWQRLLIKLKVVEILFRKEEC